VVEATSLLTRKALQDSTVWREACWFLAFTILDASTITKRNGDSALTKRNTGRARLFDSNCDLHIGVERRQGAAFIQIAAIDER
jgi:hypothetical protein